MALTEVTTINGGDRLVLDKRDQGDYRAISYTDFLAELILDIPIGRPEEDTQYAAPGATGFSVQIQDDDKDVHLILTPAAGYANGTLILPLNTNCRDKQLITVNCTQTLGALAITPNGATSVIGAPAAFVAANEFFTIEYDLATNNWYRVG